jgi:hypothetical protein
MDIKSILDKIDRAEALTDDETATYIQSLIERAKQIEKEDPKRFLEILRLNNDHFEQAVSQIDGLADKIHARIEELMSEN